MHAAAFGVAPGYVEHFVKHNTIITHDMAASIQAELDSHNAKEAERAARLSGAAAQTTVAHEALQVDPIATSVGNVATTLASMGTITEPSVELAVVPEGTTHLGGASISSAELPETFDAPIVPPAGAPLAAGADPRAHELVNA